MLPEHHAPSQSAARRTLGANAGQRHPNDAPVRIGVGIDTSRYGHHAAFLRDDLQSAAEELSFPESGHGYVQLRQRLENIGRRHGQVHFCIRLDAAGQYADNLLHYLQAILAQDAAANPPADGARLAGTISCGDPQRNKNYRAAVFGNKKSDPIEARACARYALTERPASTPALSAELRAVRQVAGRLQAVVRQRTRLINQFHHLLALTFPELALLIKDISSSCATAIRPPCIWALPPPPISKVFPTCRTTTLRACSRPHAPPSLRSRVRAWPNW
jgi:hypothetical protein